MIDRRNLVTRHNPTLKNLDIENPLSLGNGEFTFTADITGLQTFHQTYTKTPLCTMSEWGWHSYNVNLDESKLLLTPFDTYGRIVEYPTDSRNQQNLYDNLRQNPHRLNLGLIGLFSNSRMCPIDSDDVDRPEQTLNLYEGILHSEFTLYGEDVSIKTCVDPDTDSLSANIKSSLMAKKELSLFISFPYGSHEKAASDWLNNKSHCTQIETESARKVKLSRQVDNDLYFVHICFNQDVKFELNKENLLRIVPCNDGFELDFICTFTCQDYSSFLDDSKKLFSKAEKYWRNFWETGGVLQLANSTNRNALELERRVVLSQYLTAIQCSGNIPPAETGLTCNSWYGKFHLEMHYWHAAHFPQWGRPHLLMKSLDWYLKILPAAKEIAAKQGYAGARWPKMCDPSGRNSPSWIAVLLIWQQPHPIMLAELCYRATPNKELLYKYRDIIEQSAKFMVDYAILESEERMVLGPPLIPVQETHLPNVSKNPAFELEYFAWGLKTAINWLQRLGEKAPDDFFTALKKLSPLPTNDGLYLAHENCVDTFTNKIFRSDHPSMLGAFGVLPGEKVNVNIMKKTLEKVLDVWDLESMWGWDFPMMAMCCARLGLQQLAIDMLLMDATKNKYLANGHNPQSDRDDLPIYLPGNGSLLIATGMMAAGWDDSSGNFPGFPKDGKWSVEFEGIHPYI